MLVETDSDWYGIAFSDAVELVDVVDPPRFLMGETNEYHVKVAGPNGAVSEPFPTDWPKSLVCRIDKPDDDLSRVACEFTLRLTPRPDQDKLQIRFGEGRAGNSVTRIYNASGEEVLTHRSAEQENEVGNWLEKPVTSDLSRLLPGRTESEVRWLMRQDFDSSGQDLPAGWRAARGSWRLSDGTLRVTADQAYYPSFFFAPPAPWRNYAITCEMRHDQSVAGIVFRHDGQGHFYAFNVRLEESSDDGIHDFPVVEFHRYAPREDDRFPAEELYSGPILSQQEYVLSRREYHFIRVQVIDNTMQAWIDGHLVLSFEDTEAPLYAGSIGLTAADASGKHGIAFFRNLRVESLEGRTVATWQLDEGAGTLAKDGSGVDNHGTLHGGVKWVEGRDGKAIFLDGADGYFAVPDHRSQSGMSELTVHALFKLHSVPQKWAALVKKCGPRIGPSGTDDDSFMLSVDWERKLQWQTQNGVDLGRWIAYSRPLPLDAWVEVIATYDGQRNMLHTRIDEQPWSTCEGLPMPSQVRGFTIRDTAEPIEIGRSMDQREYLHATIDWIRITADPQGGRTDS